MQSSVLTTECSKDEGLRGFAKSLPIEEMLGSVTTYNSAEGVDITGGKICQQLRSSARVIKKLKLDSGLIPNPSTEKKEITPPIKEDDKNEIKTKLTRPKVVWSAEDKTHFFDAIKEYGKDFDAIHDYIVSKYKKKGLPDTQIKTKEQVRHFYYRTWQKVSKHLKFSEEVKKVVQEYYALINYGELRRKAGTMSEKTCVKLNELMYRGATQIRAKGKTVRIKTPMCRTLRKLNQIDERSEDFKLPTKVLIELRPRDMESWTNVQSMGQNPRVHCSILIQKRLHVLLSCLNSRWRTHDQRAYEKVINNQQTGIGEEQELRDPQESVLRVAPKSGLNIQIPSIQYSEFLTNCRISLNAYEERMGVKTRGETIWLSSNHSLKGSGKSAPIKKGSKRPRFESTNEKPSTVKKESTTDTEVDCEVQRSSEVRELVDSVVNTILALNNETNCDEQKAAEAVLKSEEQENVKLTEREIAIETIRNGWTIRDSESISIGELYLMIGSDSKIELEYWWEMPEIKNENHVSDTVSNCAMADIDNNHTSEARTVPVDCSKQLSRTLQNLLSLAKLYYRKERIECPCGHVCGSSANRTSAANRNKPALGPKNLQKLDTKSTQPEQQVTTMEEVSIFPANIANQRVDGLFRHPSTTSGNSRQSALEIFKAQLDALKPRYGQRRGGRGIRNKHVVQRMLPLLPKAGSGDQSIVTMKVIPQGALASDFVPIAPKLQPVVELKYVEPKPMQHSVALSPIPIESAIDLELETAVQNEANSSQKAAASSETELNIPPSPTPTISAFLDDLTDTDAEKSDNNSNCNNVLMGDAHSDVANFVAFLPGSSGTVTPLSASPSRLLKEDDNHWLNSEVADFSLSSFLGHLDSPMKPITASTVPCEDTRMSQDVESQLQSLMSESSIDYMAKFADLAAQMASENQKK